MVQILQVMTHIVGYRSTRYYQVLFTRKVRKEGTLEMILCKYGLRYYQHIHVLHSPITISMA